MREPLLGVAIGRKGVGKSYTTNKLIEEYLSDTEHLTEDQMSVVKGINTDLNAKLGSHTIKLNSTWIPKTFEFSNMFSYGPNNIIDFSNMKGAYGIFAPNASGKSTLWDALSFCIFDKCSRTSKAEDVMNYSKNSFDCKFTFDLNGVDYVIERGAKKSPKETRQSEMHRDHHCNLCASISDTHTH
jgi:GTPase SAR1 family protein